ncbi:hypothetical protein GN278_01480 [Rhodobacteraceae bacterium Araon29]
MNGLVFGRLQKNNLMLKNSELFPEYARIKEFFKKEFGLVLPDKLNAANSKRLENFIEVSGGLNGSLKLSQHKNHVPDEKLLGLISLFTVNHTSFFREKKQFQFFKEKVMPNVLGPNFEDEKSDLRVWSAAAASGEEPYSILLTMLDYFHENDCEYKGSILATDIDIEALNIGYHGSYRQNKIEGKISALNKRYFQKQTNGNLQISADLRRQVLFRWLNLNSEQYPMKRKFHAIFCRNVMLYLSKESREKIIRNLTEYLLPGGYLFLGISETNLVQRSDMRSLGDSIYQKEY